MRRCGPEAMVTPGQQVCVRAWGCPVLSPSFPSPSPQGRAPIAVPPRLLQLGRCRGRDWPGRGSRRAGAVAAGGHPSPREPGAGSGPAQAWYTVA